MPTIDIDYAELQRLLNIDLRDNVERLDEILSYVKAEVKALNQKEDSISIEMKDTNRPDLWSIEGLSRALRGYLRQQKGPKEYTIENSEVEINVNTKLYGIRPYICCSIIKNIRLSDSTIKGIMHLQDKLDQTYGRSRQKTSIGIYNLDLINPPIEYTAVKSDEVRFVPLGFSEEMSLDGILSNHPKGQEYCHIVKKHPYYPMLFDSDHKVLSFPPIINSNDLGKITEDSRNLLVEVTGTQDRAVFNVLNLVTLALIDRGGSAYTTSINYPQGSNYLEKTVITPDFSNRCFELNIDDINQLLGLNLSIDQISNALLIAGLGVGKIKSKSLTVLVPCYRVDIMHQVDIIEDVAIAYGYNNIEPLWRELATTGKANPAQRSIDLARDLMVGLGYQEVLNTTLTNHDVLFQKMQLQPTKIIEVANPKVLTMTCLRNQILPSLMEFLSCNQSVEFPQKIFELGKVTQLDESMETRTRDENWLAAVTTHPNASFSEIKSTLDSFMANLGINWQIVQTMHPSFIEGRVGKIKVSDVVIGVVGEINPAVLESWKLESPAAAFEVNFQMLIKEKDNDA